MNVSFTVVSGHSVPGNYSWDQGVPFYTASPLVCTVLLPQNDIISGYAPGVKIFLKNNTVLSTNTVGFTSISGLYVWNFNDYYNNDYNNYTLTCSADISHVYIMPGNYSTTLTVTETFLQFNPILGINETKTETKSIEQSVCVVEEILPIANLYSVTQPTIGTAPLSIRLTARTIIPGSFPVDRIVWDFGDGSEQLTVSRYYNPQNSNLIYTNIFSADPEDPRNYDVIHQYTRKVNTYPIFYPSLTAYSSSTGTYDTCSLTIGPVQLSGVNNNLHILKGRNTSKGNIYTLQYDKNVTFVVTQSSTNNAVTLIPTTPPNLIRDSFNQSILSLGNPGSVYYSVSGLC